ncbi:MAG: Flp pilus assembly complex ATPase component TadA [Candidatus Adiutrix sp.]|jgi:type IV pilus assembly protein PilB|nr:Flp pilus assembly complex ATPase component TadA [Candidatus Adiutrix sp.]
MADLSRRGASSLTGTVKDQSAESFRLLVGDYLLKAGHITRGQLEEATKWIKSRPEVFLSAFLLKKNYIESGTVSTVLSRQYNFPTINLADREITPELTTLLPYETAKKYMAVPYNKKDNKLYVAMLEPTNGRHSEELAALTKHQMMLGVAPFRDIVETFRRVYGISDEEYNAFMAPIDPKDADDAGPVTVDNLGALISDALDDFAFGDTGEDEALSAEMYSAENSTIINLANQVLLQAINEGASDVHIEPFEKQFYVRYRIDGALYKRTRLPLEIKNALIARLKIMSKLDITERRVPQDGRIKLRLSKTREIDFRVSALPTLFGESVVLRILDKSGLNVDLSKLGLSQRNLEQVKDAIYRPNGMFLVTGPTGSGKTVTLYSCLSLRNTDDVKILTAEDPVEFNFSGVNQVNVVKEVGMTFAKALKAFLRQDPDICMIGEIRDLETGEIAVEASMTGHLVLSTLHTNDAPSTVTRLIDMGVPSFNVSAALVLCTAQRLLRRICPNCKQPVNKMPANKLIEAGYSRDEVASIQLYEGRGCPTCKGSGYKGRLGAFEIMEATPIVAEAISSQVPEAQLRKIALKEGMLTLRQDGLLKAAQGQTTLAQVLEKTVLQKESLPHYLLNPDELIFTNDDVIIKEGNTDTNFYKLIQGNLGVYKGQTQIAEISARDTFFGEMSALVGGPRSATIRSQGRSIVKMFPGDKLMEVIEGYPDIAKTMMLALVDRLANANVRLSSYMHDKAELERTYIAQLTSASTAPAAPRPIASAPARRSAVLAKATVGAPARSAPVGSHEVTVPAGTISSAPAGETAPRPAAGSPVATAVPRPVATSATAPRPVAAAPSATSTPRPVTATSAPRPVPAAPAATATPRPVPVSPAATGTPRPIAASPAAASAPRPAPSPTRPAPGGAKLPERFAAPDVTRLLTPKNMAAATPATIRVTTDAPKARELKSA